jgi:hypothetical protein
LAGLVLYVEAEFWLRALHPPFWPAAICLFVLFLAVGRVLRGAVRLVRVRPRLAVAGLLLGLAPAGLLSWPLAYAARVSADRYSPHDQLFNFSTVFGAAVMHIEARRVYPYRRESQRLVMLYGDSVRTPAEDLQAMDAHVARLETQLGRKLREKIWWIRGSVFGREGVSFLGLSLGSSEGPSAGIYVDKHELAHGVIAQFVLAESDPPAVLIEGWAEAHSGYPDSVLAGRLMDEKAADPSLSIRSLLSEPWYHRHDGPVYVAGGAFTRYLLRRFGYRTFLDYYVRSRPGGVVNATPLILGVDFETLERDFWRDAAAQVK